MPLFYDIKFYIALIAMPLRRGNLVRHAVWGGAKIYKIHCADKELLEFFLKERLLASETKFEEFL